MYSRHQEYRDVFEKLYSFIHKDNQTGDGAIVITGDILHNKIDLTPECCILVYELLKRLGEIAPVFMIAGNHDALLNNRDRVDSLTSILHERMPANVYYFAHTGVYKHANLLFVVNSLLDDDPWIKPIDVRSDGYITCALYHGQVGYWVNQLGFKSQTFEKEVTDFEGADIVLLGDIHKYQYMDDMKRVAYAGSLVSQNFTETDDDHGVLVWDLKTMTSRLQRITNEYAYKQGVVKDDQVMMDGCVYTVDTIQLPSRASFRLVMQETNREMLVRLSKRFPLVRIQTVYNSETTAVENSASIKAATDNNDASFIHDYVKSRYSSVPGIDTVINELCVYYQEHISSKNDQTDWRLMSLKFTNMFGYGEDNVIDFQKFSPNTITGIFGRNSAGKSTLIDIITFMLYGKTTRSQGNSIPKELVHSKDKSSYGEIMIQIGGSRFQITKQFTRQKNDKIKIVERLFEIGRDQERHELTDEQRRRTDKLIAEKIGNLDNFLFTNVMLQQRDKSFRDMTQAHKKDFLYHVFHLDWFEKLRKDKEDQLKQVKTQIKMLLERMDGKTASSLQEDLKTMSDQYSLLEQSIQSCTQDIAVHEERKDSLLTNLVPVTTQNKDVAVIEKQILRKKNEVSGLKNKIQQNLHIIASIDRSSLQQQLDSTTEATSTTIDDGFFHKWGNNGTNQRSVWDAEYARVMSIIRDIDVLKQQWSIKKQEYEDTLAKLQQERPYIKGVCVSEEEWAQKSFDYKQKISNRSALLVQENELSRLIENDRDMDHEQIETLMEAIDKQVSQYKIEESLYRMNLEKSKEDRLIEYNPKCKQCRTNPHHLKKQETETIVQAQATQQRILLSSIHAQITQWIGFMDNNHGDADIDKWDELKEFYKKNRKNIEISKKKLETLRYDLQQIDMYSRWIEDQELLRTQRKIDLRIQKTTKAMASDETRNKYETVIQLMGSVPKYNDMDKLWRSSQVDKRMIQTQIERHDEAVEANKKLEKELKNSEEELQVYHSDKSEMLKNIQSIHSNKTIHREIDEIKTLLTQLKKKLQETTTQCNDLLVRSQRTQNIMEDYEKTHQDWTILCQQQKTLDIMIAVIERDGLPLYLLGKKLPRIEEDVNTIIRPFIHKPIICRIVEDKDIVIGSMVDQQVSGFYGGMEAFIIDVALKITFGRFGKLPRSDFFIIDEGVSVLDQERIASIRNIFEFMLSFNERVYVMSHLPVIKDFVSNRIEIEKNETTQKSKINIFY
jgi:DNA repair exonuclease SbcCD ATPase subunit